MIKIATIEDEENIRQEIVRYIKKGIGSIEGVEVDVYESAERYCSKRYVYNQISGGETRKNDTYIERSVIGRKICRDAEKPTNDS